ncbi:MAG: hypothetical protein Q9183_005232, partial [Haloplaca sp. 2 TL-2023]
MATDSQAQLPATAGAFEKGNGLNGSVDAKDLHTSAAKLSIAENATFDGSTDP